MYKTYLFIWLLLLCRAVGQMKDRKRIKVKGGVLRSKAKDDGGQGEEGASE